MPLANRSTVMPLGDPRSVLRVPETVQPPLRPATRHPKPYTNPNSGCRIFPMTRITDIVDNYSDGELATEHGLSLLVECGTERILFDTGAGDALLPNAAALGVDISSVSRIVLSHSHWDHTGGLAGLSPTCPIHVGKGIADPSFGRHPGVPVHPIGMSEDSRARLRATEVRTTDGLTEVAPGVWLRSPIPRTVPREHVNGFFLDETCACPCRVMEEQALLTADGVLVTGCCHAGLANTVEAFRTMTGLPRIRAIVGGLHLLRADAEEIAWTGDYLDSIRLESLVLLHCTGEEAGTALCARLPGIAVRGASGRTWTFA